ncbi:MAG: transglycosylase SLT domain-containing protein, partial [Myxococcales bacterium]|nr:transglycosylase SLT domain-containing protein [Myxococcales bacterium]
MRLICSIGGLLSLVWAASAATPAGDPPVPPAEDDGGTWLPGTLATLPETDLPDASIERIRQHLEAGDTDRALRDARRLAEAKRWGRERDSAWMVVGVLEQERGHHNLASEAFTRVRLADGPLTALAAFYEAEEDLARGRPWATIKECETVRERWPADEHAEDCVRLTAVAHASLGRTTSAREAASAYDTKHPKGPIGEQIELHLALRLADQRPEQAVPALSALAVDHGAALTGRLAEQTLAELHAEGVEQAVLPDDSGSRMRRAISLRDSGRRDDAWRLFQELRTLGQTEPSVARWVADNEERFGWRCWRWDDLAEIYGKAYSETPRADTAHDLYRVLVRGSRFDEAGTLALEMQKKWPTAGDWRRSQEDVGRTLMLAGRYPEAVTQFDVVVARGGWSGRRARFLAGFASLMAGDAKGAVERLDPVVTAGGDGEVEARYWRARALDALERTEEAAADRAWVLAERPWSWYATLLHQADPDLPAVTPWSRDGRWPGLLEQPTASDPLATYGGGGSFDVATSEPRWTVGALPTVVEPDLRPPSAGFASWAFSVGAPLAPSPDVFGEVLAPRLETNPIEPPPSYRASASFDPDTARRSLRTLADDNAKDFPGLVEIADLASVGLYDLAGTRMSEFYETQRKRSRAGVSAARKLLSQPAEIWRNAFLASRDHHHTARHVYGVWEKMEDPEAARDMMRLGYPLAHDRFVWAHGRDHDVDPLLVMGLMRQESTYNPTAMSHAGARGAMQIMPRTGHLLADLVHDVAFSAGDLEDPVFAVGYGIRYLGLLLDRYEGAYPLAVASYNGGPHNVSAWLGGTGLDVPTDVFVEHIPFRETRDYVKK